MAKDTFNKSMEKYLDVRLEETQVQPMFKKKNDEKIFSVKDEHPDLNDDVKVHILNKPDNMFVRMWNSMTSGVSNVFDKEEEPVPVKEEVTEELEKVRVEIDELKEEEKVDAIKQRSLLTRLLARLNFLEKKVTEEAEEEYETDVMGEPDEDPKEAEKRVLLYKAKLNDEIKTVFLMVNAFIEGLPEEKKQEFMHSPDYDKYKKILAIARNRG